MNHPKALGFMCHARRLGNFTWRKSPGKLSRRSWTAAPVERRGWWCGRIGWGIFTRLESTMFNWYLIYLPSNQLIKQLISDINHDEEGFSRDVHTIFKGYQPWWRGISQCKKTDWSPTWPQKQIRIVDLIKIKWYSSPSKFKNNQQTYPRTNS